MENVEDNKVNTESLCPKGGQICPFDDDFLCSCEVSMRTIRLPVHVTHVLKITFQAQSALILRLAALAGLL